MPRNTSTSVREVVDRLIPGGIDAYLRKARAEGQSFETIARGFATSHDLHVSTETVRRWCLPLTSTEPAGRAS